VLTVENLRKTYPSFSLGPVSFDLAPGKITGLIGRNGAGKTTTLNALFQFIHPDGGTVRFFEQEFVGHEREVKARVGVVSGGVDYYKNKKLKAITNVTRRFYPTWDEDVYRKTLAEFQLDEGKTPAQLSAGMKVKYALTLALSHRAELLILDEPTSGLDPVSREELLEKLLELRDEGTTILFSTHITSDLDKCADDLLYLREGKLLAAEPLDGFVTKYRLAELTQAQREALEPGMALGCRRRRNGVSVLVRAEDAGALPVTAAPADLDAIMVHLEGREEP
jgi:ABC-2 type transport system ATP-binding protein